MKITPPPANLGLRPSLPGDLLFLWGFIDFMISSKDISSIQRSKSLLNIFFLLEISCSFGSYLFGVEFFRNFFADLRILLKLVEYLYLYNQFIQFKYRLILHILSIKYFEESFRGFFALQLPCNVSTKFITFCLFVF